MHTLITDSRANTRELEAVREAGVEVRVADVGEREQARTTAG
jgi:hypothetical protein